MLKDQYLFKKIIIIMTTKLTNQKEKTTQASNNKRIERVRKQKFVVYVRGVYNL